MKLNLWHRQQFKKENCLFFYFFYITAVMCCNTLLFKHLETKEYNFQFELKWGCFSFFGEVKEEVTCNPQSLHCTKKKRMSQTWTCESTQAVLTYFLFLTTCEWTKLRMKKRQQTDFFFLHKHELNGRHTRPHHFVFLGFLSWTQNWNCAKGAKG